MAKRLHGALICARYSTDNQNPDSIEVQVAKCTEWCHTHNIPVLGVYADEATSGMKDTRPRYAAMMRDLRDGVGDMVVIYDQSRMFRKMTSWFSFRDQLTQMGVDVVSVTQPMIGKDLRDPTNFLTEGSMALFNQIWALQSRQKVMEKMVRRIFEEYGSGKSYREIVAGLNADGIKTKRGSAFGANSLHDLLKNEKYIGTLVYGQRPYREDGTRNTHAAAADSIRIENAIPAIIDKELFAKVQDKMAANKRQQGGRPPTKRDYPLKGKVFCAECKSAMTISTSQKIYDYYKCSGKKRRHDCDGVNISVDVLERTVANAVRQVLGSPKNVERLITILRDQSGEIQAQAVDALRQLIAREREISRKLDNATDAILGGLSSPTLLARVKDLEQEKTEIDRQMRELKATVDASAIPETRLREIIDEISGDNPAGNAALLAIVCRVEVAKDTITIWTMLDTHPDGTFDWSEEGVLITPGTTSGVPKESSYRTPL